MTLLPLLLLELIQCCHNHAPQFGTLIHGFYHCIFTVGVVPLTAHAAAAPVSYTHLDVYKRQEILKHIDLTVRDNEFMVITGPNGGGQSTLAKLIAGIVTPTSGQILLDGQDITGLDITNRANIGISFAFQQPVRFKGITVRDLLSLASGKDLSVRELSLIHI